MHIIPLAIGSEDFEPVCWITYAKGESLRAPHGNFVLDLETSQLGTLLSAYDD